MVSVTLESGGQGDPLPAGRTNWMGKTDPDGFCSIKVNGVEQGLNSIGFNIVVLKHADQNPPEQYSCFDTCKDPTSPKALVDFLKKIQPGRIVLMAACKSICDCVTQELCDELVKLGSGYFGKGMAELSGAHRGESWVMAAKQGGGLIKESFRAGGKGPTVETFDI